MKEREWLLLLLSCCTVNSLDNDFFRDYSSECRHSLLALSYDDFASSFLLIASNIIYLECIRAISISWLKRTCITSQGKGEEGSNYKLDSLREIDILALDYRSRMLYFYFIRLYLGCYISTLLDYAF